MNDLTKPEHAGWFADVRRLLDVTETTPGLPLPRIAPDRVTFFFVGIAHAPEAVTAVRCAETALRCALLVAFYPRRTQDGYRAHYILTAFLPSGLQVDIVALAEHFDGQDARRDAPELASVAA
jgi:hypothetical protein